MKKTTLFFIITVFFAQAQPTGGPDAYGYTWTDSYNANGPQYNWVDIANPTSGIQVSGLGDDNVVGPFSFSAGVFDFYWYSVNKFWVGSNGYISFNNVNIASPFPNIPTAGGGQDDFIAAFMSDLKFDGVGNPAECWVSKTSDSTIISYINVPFWNPAGLQYTGSNTFQIVLDPTTKAIYFNYQQQQGTSYNSDIKIGIENLSGSIGLQHSSNTYPPTNYTIRFDYPDTVTYQVLDASVQWNSVEASKGIFLPLTGQHNLITSLSNTGNQPLSSFQANGSVTFYNNTMLSDIIMVPALQPGEDTIMSYTQAFLPTTGGSHSYTTALTPPPGDLTPTNNNTTQEIVVVDETQATINLDYSDGSPDGVGISWNGGNGGIGVYFKPPSYPANVLSTKYYISSNLFLAGFAAMIYDDDGTDGSAGTLLDSVFVSPTQVLVGAYNNIPVGQSVEISEGGVFVLWYMLGTDIQLAKDTSPPFSKQTYEVIDNVWAEYRAMDEEDFLISLDYEMMPPVDAGIINIANVLDGETITDPMPLTIEIKNFGQSSLSGFELSFQLSGNVINTETYLGAPINPGGSMLYTFQNILDPTQGGTQLCVWTNALNDIDPMNDIVCIGVNAVSIKEETGQNLIFYPNPTTGEVFVKTKEKARLYLYTKEGVLLFQKEIKNGEKLNLTNLSPGVYFYKTNKQEAGKLLISK